MSETVGELKIALTFDGQKFKVSQKQVESGINQTAKEAEKTLTKADQEMIKKATAFGSTVGNVAANAITKLASISVEAVKKVGTAVFNMTKEAFNLYGEYEQLVGGVETLFAQNAPEVVENAKKAFQTAQMSANDYMSTVTSFSASLLQSLGGDTAKAAKYADRAIVDMSDNANKMGTDISMIQSAYQGFAKQNYTMLDNLKLGYGGTKTEMERLIADASKMTDVQRELGITVQEGNMSFANMVNAISVVQKKMGIMGTSAAEASKTVQGSFNAMKSSWKNFLTTLGDPDGDIDKAMDDLLVSIEIFMDNAIPLIGRILKKIADKLPELADELMKRMPEFIQKMLPALVMIAEAIIEHLPEVIDMIADMLPDLIERLLPKLIVAVVKVALKLIQKLPEIIGSIFKAIFEATGTLLNEFGTWLGEMFGPILENIGQFFGDLFGNIGQFFSDVFNNIGQWASDCVENIKNFFGGIAEWFGNVFRNAWQAVKAVFETGGKIFTGIVEGITAAFKAVVNAIISGINFVIAIPFNAINGFLSTLKAINIFGLKPFDWIGTISVPQIPLLAEGGYADGASEAIIGEQGKEVVLPLENNTDNWSGLLAKALADRFEEDNNSIRGGVTIETQNINVDSKLDAENIGHIMMQSIRRQAR